MLASFDIYRYKLFDKDYLYNIECIGVERYIDNKGWLNKRYYINSHGENYILTMLEDEYITYRTFTLTKQDFDLVDERTIRNKSCRYFKPEGPIQENKYVEMADLKQGEHFEEALNFDIIKIAPANDDVGIYMKSRLVEISKQEFCDIIQPYIKEKERGVER